VSERNHISNGRFLHDLDNWDAVNAAYSAGDGDEHYGVAVLQTGGGYIEQDFTVRGARAFSLHVAVKCSVEITGGNATLRIVDGDGNTVLTQNLSGDAGAWTETTYSYGLAEGTTYTLRITNVSTGADLKVDDIWLWWVPMTRAQIAARVHAKLGRLATERSLSTAAAGELTEGDYTYAVDAGLRQVGAINRDTDAPDLRYLSTALVDAALDATEREMLEQLQRDYAVEVDIKAGPHSEHLSQIAKQLSNINSSKGGGGGRVVMRRMHRSAKDYTFQ
jgi:hypothetical protein